MTATDFWEVNRLMISKAKISTSLDALVALNLENVVTHITAIIILPFSTSENWGIWERQLYQGATRGDAKSKKRGYWPSKLHINKGAEGVSLDKAVCSSLIPLFRCRHMKRMLVYSVKIVMKLLHLLHFSKIKISLWERWLISNTKSILYLLIILLVKVS